MRVVATERGIALGRAEGLSDLAEAIALWDDPTIRTNEGGCDPDGRFWIGTMSYDKTSGTAAVYRWDGPGAEPRRAWGGTTISNGLGFSPDGTRTYWIDTPTLAVTVMDYYAGAGPVDPRPFVRVEEGAGCPDGLAVDADGGVWVALNGGGATRGYDARGRLVETVEVPVRQVTACAFGGGGPSRLFITALRENLPDDVEPTVGSVYVAEVGARGMEPLPFWG